MKVYSTLIDAPLADVPERTVALQSLGVDGLFTGETNRDPFLPLVLAAQHSTDIDIGTGIALGLPRSPVHLAHLAHDLQTLSKGRFVLGLGSQIGTHVKKRFGVPANDKPAARMRDLIRAIRATWDCWNRGHPLNHRGEFYRLTLMPPFFNPGPSGFPDPRIFLAAVGPHMTEAAASEADGIVLHAFTTPDYLNKVTIPALEHGLDAAGRQIDDFRVMLPLLTVCSTTDEGTEMLRFAVRQQLAFYASTPAYRAVLELHGWGDLQRELTTLAQFNRWAEMGKLIDDEMLETFAVCATPEELPTRIEERFGRFVDAVGLFMLDHHSPDRWSEAFDRIRSIERTWRSALG